jgi:hypothetical protein
LGEDFVKICARDLVAASVLSMLFAAGCGSGGDGGGAATNGEEKKSLRQVGDDAAGALKAASGVHLVGATSDNGKQVRLNLKFQGADIAGTVTQDGHATDIIKVGPASYLKADSGYYQAQGASPQAASLAADKWVKLPASSASTFDSFTLASLADELKSGPGDRGTVTQGSLNGRQVVVLKTPDGSASYIANTGAPVPLRVEKPGADGGRFDLTEYGMNFDIKAPAESVELPTG